jgi:hypothetical protein
VPWAPIKVCHCLTRSTWYCHATRAHGHHAGEWVVPPQYLVPVLQWPSWISARAQFTTSKPQNPPISRQVCRTIIQLAVHLIWQAWLLRVTQFADMPPLQPLRTARGHPSLKIQRTKGTVPLDLFILQAQHSAVYQVRRAAAESELVCIPSKLSIADVHRRRPSAAPCGLRCFDAPSRRQLPSAAEQPQQPQPQQQLQLSRLCNIHCSSSSRSECRAPLSH